MSYHHLTISERIRIEVLSILGYSPLIILNFILSLQNDNKISVFISKPQLLHLHMQGICN